MVAALLALTLFFLALPCLKNVFALVTGRAPSPTDIAGTPVPEGCRIVNRVGRMAGIDASFAVEVAFRDDRDVPVIAAQLGVERAEDANLPFPPEPISFVSLQPPEWWPNLERLEVWSWEDRDNERYRTMWVDRERKRLIVEWGGW